MTVDVVPYLVPERKPGRPDRHCISVTVRLSWSRPEIVVLISSWLMILLSSQRYSVVCSFVGMVRRPLSLVLSFTEKLPSSRDVVEPSCFSEIESLISVQECGQTESQVLSMRLRSLSAQGFYSGAQDGIPACRASICQPTAPIIQSLGPGGEPVNRVRQANWYMTGGGSLPERRSNRSTFLREPCAGTREGKAKRRQRCVRADYRASKSALSGVPRLSFWPKATLVETIW